MRNIRKGRQFRTRPGVRLSAGSSASSGLLYRHLALNGHHQPDVNNFWNFPRSHPLIHLDNLSNGVESEVTLRTLSDVRLQFPARRHVRHYVRVIGKLVQELFTGKQTCYSLFGGCVIASHNCERRRQEAALNRRHRNPRSLCGFLSPQFFDVSQYRNASNSRR
jgi:hypothetical protein